MTNELAGGAGPRTSPGSVLFSSYNLLNLFAGDAAEDRGHYEAVTGVIRALGTDVLAVQEILAPDGDTAAQRLRRLADDAGLHCEVPGPGGARDAALAFGGHGYHVGLMWRDGIEPVPGSLRCYGGRDFWHGLAIVTLDVGGALIRHGAFHATPFGRGLRADQNERLVAAITRPAGEPPGDRAARRRHGRAPGARHRADAGGLRPPPGDGRVPAGGGARLARYADGRAAARSGICIFCHLS